jgi:hypothetical protein
MTDATLYCSITRCHFKDLDYHIKTLEIMNFGWKLHRRFTLRAYLFLLGSGNLHKDLHAYWHCISISFDR